MTTFGMRIKAQRSLLFTMTCAALMLASVAACSSGPSCQNLCTAGQTQCSGVDIQTCVTGADGCFEFGTPTSCGSNEICVGDTCQQQNTSSCSASNCTGCCFNGTCQTGSTTSACGKGGAACAVCGNSQTCTADQTCGVDPNSTWLVQPVSATITTTNNGNAWDPDGSPPDVFVAMACPPNTSWWPNAPSSWSTTSTPYVSNSFSPTWSSGGCSATAAQLLAGEWAFQLWDYDTTTNDAVSQLRGTQITEANLMAGTVSFSAFDAVTSFVVHLEKQ